MSVLARVRVSVPASTSNIGPGFDCAGMALRLRNELVVEVRSGPRRIEVAVSGEGAGSLERGARNLAARALQRLYPLAKARGTIQLSCDNRVPLARGLGSSAAAVVAGLAAGRALARRDDDLLPLACAFEGHPDNVAAALGGGLVVSGEQAGKISTFRLTPHRRLTAVVAVPDFQLATAKARAVLPAKVPRGDAVFNVARAMLLASALERGLWERLAFAMDDRLHQPYRRRLVKGFDAVVAAARAAGAAGACLSGAGPSILALLPEGPRCARVGEAMRRAWRAEGVGSRVMILKPDAAGVQVWRDK